MIELSCVEIFESEYKGQMKESGKIPHSTIGLHHEVKIYATKGRRHDVISGVHTLKQRHAPE